MHISYVEKADIDLTRVQSHIVQSASPHGWTLQTMQVHKDEYAARAQGNFAWKCCNTLGITLQQAQSIHTIVFLTTFILMLCVFATIAYVAPQALLFPSKEEWHNTTLPVLLFYGIFLAMWIVTLVCSLTEIRIIAPGRWDTYAWSPLEPSPKGMSAVPSWAREIALNLVGMKPGVTFSVLELKQDKVLLDPVLLAHIHGRDVPLCAWNPDGSVIEPPK